MDTALLDTNVLVRFLVTTPETIAKPQKGVFTFFPKVENGELRVVVPDLVVFETFFVLRHFYSIPQSEAAEKLAKMIAFKGMVLSNKPLMQECFQLLQTTTLDLVDSYLLVLARVKKSKGVYSFDKDFKKQGLTLLPVE